jgi:hypothetical protein
LSYLFLYSCMSGAMPSTPYVQQVDFASITLGTPGEPTQSVIHAQSKSEIHRHAVLESLRRSRYDIKTGINSTRINQLPGTTGKFRIKPAAGCKRRKPKTVVCSEDMSNEEEAVIPRTIPRSPSASQSNPFGNLPISIGPCQEVLLRLCMYQSFSAIPSPMSNLNSQKYFV